MDTICLDPDRPTLDARDLDRLIAVWIEDRAGNLPSYTVAGYAGKLRYFRDWWAAVGPAVGWRLTEQTLLDFNKHLNTYIGRRGESLSYNTRLDALRRLQAVFSWAFENKYINYNYGKLLPSPTGSAPVRTAAPLDCLRRLLAATEESNSPVRDRAILAVLLGTGVRRAECASIKVESVRIDADNSGELQVMAKKVAKRATGQRVVAFDSATGVYIRAYLDAYGLMEGPLFRSEGNRERGNRLTVAGIYKVIKKLIKKAGLQNQIQGPHDLRRNFATYFSRKRRGDSHGQLLSKQLGHSTYRMTARYTLQDVEDVREVIISPFALLE